MKEFIGCQLIVVQAANKSLEGLSGTIIMETKNTFIVKTKKNRKIVLKNGTKFKIDGKEFQGDQKRPEERRE